jgi:hypothetical protein
MRAQHFAAYLEQLTLPLHGAALDAAHVIPGMRLLDAGCGAGLLALLASLRGAKGDRPRRLAGALAIARERLPAADVREGDLEAPPFRLQLRSGHRSEQHPLCGRHCGRPCAS